MANHESGTVDEATNADLVEESMAAQRRSASHADAAGAALIVIAITGGIAWAWELLRTQLVGHDPGSLGARLDLLAVQTPVLLLSGAVAGLGIGLRTLSATQTGSAARPVFGRPVAQMLLILAAALVVFLGGAATVGDHDNPTPVLDARYYDSLWADDFVPVEPPKVSTAGGPPELTHTLEVHSDACGVTRSGDIGDKLTWVINDQDGFQVLGRNAAGETQYRYFQSGTYTVVLEAWGGAYYAEVSNEVTITC